TGEFARRDPAQVPALIMLDVTSGVGGLAALKVIKLYIQTHSVPVVMIADPTDHQAVSTGYRLGANGCIPKSPNREYLKTNIALVARYWLKIRVRSTIQSQASV